MKLVFTVCAQNLHNASDHSIGGDSLIDVSWRPKFYDKAVLYVESTNASIVRESSSQSVFMLETRVVSSIRILSRHRYRCLHARSFIVSRNMNDALK
jgi:hypothetical protein